MNLTEELRKLANLHQEGHLTAEEFAEAKRSLIATASRTAGPAAETTEDDPGQSAGKTFVSSRWSSGNWFFPDSLTLAEDGMLFRKRALVGSREEHINYRAIASFRIKNGFFLSDVCIETSGGSQPIFVNGLWKSDAQEVQELIRNFQRRR